MKPIWMTPVPEPANGRYVLVGDNPCEYAAVRADRLDATTGEWYPLLGAGCAPLLFEQVTAPGDGSHQASTVVLYRASHAIEDLVAAAGVVTYQRLQAQAATAASGTLAGQYAQAAMAVRSFVNDLAARHGAPAPRWDPPSPPAAPGQEDTQVLAPVPLDDAQDIGAIQRQLTGLNPAPAPAPAPAAEGSQAARAGADPEQRSWRNRLPVWPWADAAEPRPGGRHRRPWGLGDLKRLDRGDSGAMPKVGAPG